MITTLLNSYKFIIAFLWHFFDVEHDEKSRFNEYARCDIFCGKTGQGKTLCAVREMKIMKKQFKNLKIISNIASPLVDIELTRSSLLATYNFPVLVVIDEANTTFSGSRVSSIPPDVKSFIFQTRKGYGKRLILLTQDYSLIDVSFRKLSHYVYNVKTFWGRLTALARFEQVQYERNADTGGIDYGKKNLSYARIFFIQTNRLRRLYDFKSFVNTNWI